jgi:hypothetical protein
MDITDNSKYKTLRRRLFASVIDSAIYITIGKTVVIKDGKINILLLILSILYILVVFIIYFTLYKYFVV